MIKRISRSSLVLILTALTVGVAFMGWVAYSNDKRMRTELIEQTRIAARAINSENVASLSGSEKDLNTSSYQRLKSQLAFMREANHYTRFLYLMGQHPDGSIFFFADSLSADSKDYVSPGTIYEDVPDSYLSVFITKQETVVGPVTDQWGTLVTALVPINDLPPGNFAVVLGMDVDASDWGTEILGRCFISFVGILCITALILLSISRMKAEKAMRESEGRFKALADASFGGVIIHDKGLILECNTGLSTITGFNYEEHIGMNGLELIAPESLDTVLANIRSDFDQRYEVFGVRKDGSNYPLAIRGKNVTYKGSDARVIEFRDLTERKKAEEEKQSLEHQLQQSQKLESLGVLSGGIAHDFNNILAIIIGYCGLIKLKYETAEKNIPKIEKAAERAAGLCQQMSAYAGKTQLTKTKVNMVTKVDDIVGMLKLTLPQNAVIKTDLSAQISLIEGDASQLRQVVMNLIINASEAIGTEQGEVNISLDRIKVESGKSYEDYHGKAFPSGEYVCLEVTDNGCGMDEATKWRIFEPFYTTKFTGRGLGMSAVLGIIKSHAGALQLFSQPGQGTTFKVYLPALISETAEDEVHSAPVPATLWQGSGTILLAEDEAQVRHIAKELLEMFGFTVLEAVNGKEALEIYLENSAEITLVVTDMGMPVMDGYELFSELKKLNPELPIIVSSGYGDAEVSTRIGIDNIAGVISKPYNTDQLWEVLKTVMEGTASTNA